MDATQGGDLSAAGVQLLDEHVDDLRKSGLNNETIAGMRAHSLSAAELARVLGYNSDGVRSALALPYPGLDFARYKLFPPGRGADGRPIRYMQASGSGVHLYIPPKVRAVLPDATVPLYWAEGEKKAARAMQDSIVCLGLGGLWNWLQAGTADGIAELGGIVHVQREEIIVPDSDVWTRPDLLQAVYAFGKELEARGARVSVTFLPTPDGAKVGLDDFLVANGADTFRALRPIPLKHNAFTKQREWYPTWKASRVQAVADAATGQGIALTLGDPESWPGAVDGAALLDAIARVHARYLVLPDSAADAAALWVLHTYLIGALHVSPILAVTSPQKRCGKSTLLDVLRALVRRPLGASNISPAALFRVVELSTPTLLIDEADTFLREKEELRGIINAGHTRSTAQVVRTVGDDHEPRVFRTFCAKALAAIGELPGTVDDRAINIRMQRRAPGENVERLRRDRIDAELEPLRRKAARWAADKASSVRDADPAVPDTLHDRAADNWRPLLSIADAAGDDWPRRARRAAEILSGAVATEDSDVRVQLLADVRQLFNDRGTDKLPSESIVEHLTKLEHRPWPEWSHGKRLTARGLARLLKPFGIVPKTVRVSAGETPKGYDRKDFEDAFARYVPVENATTPQPAPALEKIEISHPPQAPECGALENATSPYSDKACGGVADRREVVEI